MNATTHPDTEQLSAYIINPESGDHRDICLHLAQCADCRALTDTLERVQHGLSAIERDAMNQSIANNENLRQAFDEQLIEKYVDGVVSATERKEVEQLLRTNTQAMKAGLHYASHSSAMAREAAETSGKRSSSSDEISRMSKSEPESSIFSTLARWLHFQTPAWVVAPVAAALVLVVNLVTVPLQVAKNDQLIVAQYQDNPVIQFSTGEKTPGIGFFADANTTTKPYDRIITTIENDGFMQLAWTDIDGADTYTIQLHIFKNGQRNKVLNLTTKDTNVRFKRIEQDIGQRYEWDLSGITLEGKKFQASGGFIIQPKGE